MAAATFTLDVDVTELAGGAVEDARVVIEAMVTPRGDGIVTDPATGRIYVTEVHELGASGVGSVVLPVSAQMSPAGYQYGATVEYRREGDRTYRSVPRIVFNSGGANAVLKLGNVAPQAVVLPPTYFPGGLPGPQGIPGTPGTGSVNLPVLMHNLVPNGGVRDNLWNWVAEDNVALARVPDAEAHTGYALEATQATAGSAASARVDLGGMTAGRAYTLRWRVRRTAGDQGHGLTVVVGPEVAGVDYVSGTATTQTRTLTFVAGSAGGSLFFYNASARQVAATGTGSQQRILDVTLTDGPTAPSDYFDGDDPGCTWDGTRNQSASAKRLYDADDVVRTERTPELARNLIPDPKGRNLSDLLGSATAVRGAWRNGEAITVRVPENATNSDTYVGVAGDAGGIRLGLKPGTTYTLSATIHLDAALTGALNGESRGAMIYWLSPAGYQLALAQAPNAAGDWPVTVTGTIPADATEAWVRLYVGSNKVGEQVSFGDLMLTEGTTKVAPFDGDTPGCRWLGTPHASQSVRMLPTGEQTLVNVPELARNLLRMPRPTDGWVRWWNDPTLEPSSEVGPNGEPVTRLVMQSAGTVLVGPPDQPGVRHRVEAGREYVAHFLIKPSVDLTSVRVSTIGHPGDSQLIDRGGYQPAPANRWTRIVNPITAVTSGTVQYTVNVEQPLSSGTVVLIAGNMWEEGTAPSAAFDGDTAGCRWVGKRGASESVKMLPSRADHDLLVWLDAGRAQGVGSPEGRVVAKVGTRYVDTQATAGAVEWMKLTGTGAYGWTCTTGDTGVRLLYQGGVFPPGVLNGMVWVQRVGNVVTVDQNVQAESEGVIALADLPPGLRPRGRFYLRDTNNTSAMDLTEGDGRLNLNARQAGWHACRMVFPTSTPWPTSLPGYPG